MQSGTGEDIQKKGTRGTSPRICTELPQSSTNQPTQSDIQEFGRRIGIDIRREPDLVHLAVEGLQKPLPPNWKPCFDPIRNVYYYLDTNTQKTQWEHPLDSVYKLKVTQARETSQTQMERGQGSNPPMKALNPLPKASLKDFPPRRKDILGPPLPVSLNPLPAALPAPVPPDAGKETADPAGGILDLVDLKGRANRLAPLKGLKPVGGSETHPKALQGTIPSNPPKMIVKLEEGRKIPPPNWVPNEETVQGDSYEEDEVTSSVSAFGHRIPKPNLIQLTPTAHDLRGVSNFGVKRNGPIRAKGNVQFNLDQEVEFKFETSSQGSSNQSNEDATGSEDVNSSGSQSGDEEEEASDPMPKSQPSQPIRLTPVSTVPTKSSVTVQAPIPAVQETRGTGDRGSKDEDRKQMEAELLDSRAKLDEQRKERLRDLQKEHEEKVQKEKASLDLSLEKELTRVREEQNHLLTTQVESIRLEMQEKLEVQKKEIQDSNQEILQRIEEEIEKVDRVTLLDAKKRELFAAIEKEAVEGVEEMRATLLAQHKKEIDQSRSAHDAFLRNLKEEFRKEEEKLRAKQAERIEELRQIPNGFPRKNPGNSAVTNEATAGTNQKTPISPDSPIGSHSPVNLERERELVQTKRKYKSLQEKYVALKEELKTASQRHHGETETLSVLEDSANDTMDMDTPMRNDRLGSALGALEILRAQILDMNRVKVAEEPSPSTRVPNDPKSRKERVRARSPSPRRTEPSKKTPGKPQFASVRRSRDVTPPSKPDEEFDEFEVMREAKAFIQSQRRRLKMDPLEPSRDTRHQSEGTESSGIGSLKRTRRVLRESPSPKSSSPHKSRVAKDIDTILHSLKKLDGEMECLWRMVGQEGDKTRESTGGGFLVPLIHPTSPAAMAQFNVMREKGSLDSLLNSSPWNSLLTNTDLRTRYRLTGGGDSVPSSPPTLPNHSILQNLEFNQPSRHVFEDEMQNFEALQERIWKTYGPGEGGAEDPSSIQAKTKDLREWLHKF